MPVRDDPFGQLLWSNVAIAGVALFLSHGASFLFNYIGRGEYLTASPTRQMGAPYGRVVVLHLTILFGAFAVAFLGSPVGALLILVGLKTALDLGLHRRNVTRRRAGPSRHHLRADRPRRLTSGSARLPARRTARSPRVPTKAPSRMTGRPRTKPSGPRP